MIQVNILKPDGSVGWAAQWSDQNLVDKWIQQGQEENWWGKSAIVASKSQFFGALVGGSSSISIEAANPGSLGNIQLLFDGLKSVAQVIQSWNSQNPNNQVFITSGDDSQIPSAQSISLTGGIDAKDAEYSIVQTDITAQYQLQQATQKALENQNLGATVVATVAAINESKLAAGTMTQQTFNALLADQNVSNIERLLWNGSLITAKAMIQSVDLSAYYTSDEVASIVALLP